MAKLLLFTLILSPRSLCHIFSYWEIISQYESFISFLVTFQTYVRIVGFLFLTIYGCAYSWAQSLESENYFIDISIPQVSLLSAGDEASVHFDVQGPDEAGHFVTTLHDSTIKLKYSTVSGSNSTYSVFSRIDLSPLGSEQEAGRQMIYSLELVSFQHVKSESCSFLVHYTISD